MNTLEQIVRSLDICTEIENGIDGGRVAYLHCNQYCDSIYLFDDGDGDVHVIVEIGGGVQFSESFDDNALNDASIFFDENVSE